MYDTIIIIPYRNRKQHLVYFLNHTWPLLKKHMDNIKLVIVEQEEGKLFNRGKVLNVGFQEYKDQCNYFIIHDVDINPKDSILSYYFKPLQNQEIRGIYTSKWKTLGGIVKIKSSDIHHLSGFPNDFWGWGVEDRALYNRALFYDYNVKRIVITKTPEEKQYFHRFYDVKDQKRDSTFGIRTRIEYDMFHTWTRENQQKHIMKSGLHNLEYRLLKREELDDDIDKLIVSI